MEYRVVKIVDEYLIVVNYGEIHNAREGDLLEIFQIGEKVYDIDSTFLGTLDLKKGRVRVLNVYKNMSLCESDEKVTNSSSVGANLFFKVLTNSQVSSLNVDLEQISGGYSKDKDLIIQIGDPVKLINSKFLESLKKVEEDEEDEEEEDMEEEN